MVQNTHAASIPNTTNTGLNLSSKAGSTTEASATNPMSEAISDNFSSCLLFSRGNFMAFVVVW